VWRLLFVVRCCVSLLSGTLPVAYRLLIGCRNDDGCTVPYGRDVGCTQTVSQFVLLIRVTRARHSRPAPVRPFTRAEERQSFNYLVGTKSSKGMMRTRTQTKKPTRTRTEAVTNRIITTPSRLSRTIVASMISHVPYPPSSSLSWCHPSS
jgi:hypothetical protein